MAPTSGFSLSALPSSPTVPAGVGKLGEIDAREIYDSVRAGLNTVEAARNSPNRLLMADEQTRTALSEGEARRAVLPTLTNATLVDTPNRSRILAAQADAAGIDTPVHSRLLSAQAGTAEGNLDAQIHSRQRESGLRANAAGEMPAFLKERDEANRLADFNATAAALGNLRVKYPWVSLPEYKDSIGKSLDEEQQAALKAAQAQEANTSRERIAETRAAGSVDAVRLRQEASKTSAALRGGVNATLARQAELIEVTSLFPDDMALAQQLESVNAVLRNQQASEMKNPNAAKTSPPAGLVLLQTRQKAQAAADLAQGVLDDALADGDPEVIQAAQADFNAAAKLLQDATQEHSLYHAERTKKISKGIDEAAIKNLAASLAGSKGSTPGATPKAGTAAKQLTPEQAKQYLDKAGGDKVKAREMAKKDGWAF